MKTIVEVAQNLIKPYIVSEDKKYAANVAPVETSPATATHTAGTQIIYNGVLYDVTADIAINDALATTGAGANIAAADDVSEQISNVKQALSNEVETRATLGTHNIFPFVYSLDTWIDSDCTKAESSGVVTYTATGSYARVGYWYPNALEVGKKYVINFKKKCTFSANAIRVQFATTQTMTTSDPSMFKVFEYTASDADYVEETYEFTATSTDLMFGVYVQAGSGTGNVIAIKEIQITLATDAKTGYSPYVPTNSQLLSYKDNGVLGAKNYLKNTATSGNNGSGVSWVVNADKTLIITKSDSSTANIDLALAITLPKGTYKISGTPSDGDYANKYAVFVAIGSTTIATDATNTLGLKDTFTVTNEAQGYNVRIIIRTGSGEFSNIVFSPMIRLASDTDPTYQPYAMTNKELTDSKAEKSDLASINITGTTNSTGSTIASGTYFYLNGTLVKAKTSIANGATLTSGTNYEAVTAGILNQVAETKLLAQSDFTSEYTISSGQENYNSISKNGKLVTLSLDGSCNTLNSSILLLPSGYYPPQRLRTALVANDSTTVVGFLVIYPTGQVEVNSTYTQFKDKRFMVTISYVVA